MRAFSKIVQFFLLMFLFMVAGCQQGEKEALGTLEWDRVNSRSPANVVIQEFFVDQGDQVAAGAVLLKFDDRKIRKKIEELKALHTQAIWHFRELKSGPRPQTIAEAKARVEAARTTKENSKEIFNRKQYLSDRKISSREQLDNARNDYLNAKERYIELTESLDKLLVGTRVEQLEQAQAKTASLKAQIEYQQLVLEDYIVKAQRAGVVDSLPFKKGDKLPLNTVVCTLLSGNNPWARVYVPEGFRSRMLPGDDFSLKIDGQQQLFTARLRHISSESSFTPYYALSESDRSRLSYVAELDILDKAAIALTVGTPVQLLMEKE